MAKEKTLVERGKFKNEINSALYKNEDIRELLLGDTTGMSSSEIRKEFKQYVKSHLFIDDTLTEARTFIFYDVVFPFIESNVKNCRIMMYLICARSILENYIKEGYYGDRIDILAQMVEDTLINNDETANSFGIGKLNLDSIDVYNSQRFYGCVLTFNVPSFR